MDIRLAASRVVQSEFGVISAHREGRSAEENGSSHAMLKGDLNAMGYDVTEANGEWKGIPEKCFTVPAIKPDILLQLGMKYRQEAVIYCQPGGEPKVVGMDWLEELGRYVY